VRLFFGRCPDYALLDSFCLLSLLPSLSLRFFGRFGAFMCFVGYSPFGVCGVCKAIWSLFWGVWIRLCGCLCVLLKCASLMFGVPRLLGLAGRLWPSAGDRHNYFLSEQHLSERFRPSVQEGHQVLVKFDAPSRGPKYRGALVVTLSKNRELVLVAGTALKDAAQTKSSCGDHLRTATGDQPGPGASGRQTSRTHT
jgi:hypothetical protein